MLSPAAAPVNFAGPGRTGSIVPEQAAPIVPINPTDTQLQNRMKATEPAVLSSDGAQERIDAGKSRLAELSTKGAMTGPNGTAVYANGSAIPAPPDATVNNEGLYEAADGKKYSAAEFYGNDTSQPDEDFTAVQKLFAPLKEQLDANTLDSVNAIHQQFNSLQGKLEAANTNADKSNARALLLSGTSRYSPLTASGITLAQTSNGLLKIQDLDAQENAAIAAAKTAQESGDHEIMLDKINMAEGIRKDKQAAAAKLQDTLTTANNQLRQTAITSSRDNAIADLVAQGITDPTQLLGYLNNYDDGTPTGGEFTSDEVAKTLANLTVDGNARNLSADLQTFNYIKNNFGLPEEISSLPPQEQYFAYLAALKKASTTPKASTDTGYTALEKRKLRQAGIDPSDTEAADNYLYEKKTPASTVDEPQTP